MFRHFESLKIFSSKKKVENFKLKESAAIIKFCKNDSELLKLKKTGQITLKMKKLRVELEIEEFFHLELAKLVNILR